MIEKFATLREASAFVEEKRAEGYLAEIENENVAQLWGPNAAGGYRVWVSDEKVDPEQEAAVAERKAGSEAADRWIRIAVLAFLGLGLLSLLANAIAHFLRE